MRNRGWQVPLNAARLEAGDFELPEGAGSSELGAYFLEPDAPSVIMTYAGVLLLAAEAAARGWISASPAELYRAGIVASMRQYGIAPAAIEANWPSRRWPTPGSRASTSRSRSRSS